VHVPMAAVDDQMTSLLDELDRLEDAAEDMKEFGLRTINEVEHRIAEIHSLLDRLTAE
jgi:hypothetical protein